jgi:hypothetical protein
LSFIGRLFFKCPAHDFHCGLRGFTKAAFEKMDLQTTGMEFASEMVIKSTLKKLKITEVPVTLHPDGRSRPPHLKPWRDGWRHLRFMLLFSPRWLFLVPGIFLSLLGIILPRAFVRHFRRRGVERRHADVACMAVIVGFQLVAFAFFTKVFAIAEGLLPDDPKFSRVFKFFTLEKGILLGLAVLLAGILCSCAPVWIWHQAQLRRAAVYGRKSAPADSRGHAHRPRHPGRFFQLLHERAGAGATLTRPWKSAALKPLSGR